DTLVQELGWPRQPGRHPGFDVWVALHESPPKARTWSDGLRVGRTAVDFPISLFDLSFNFELERDCGRCELWYDTDLYERRSVSLLVERFRSLVRELPALLETRLGALELVDARPAETALPSFSFLDGSRT